MKLHIWRPRGHGEPSYFVIAETKEEAFQLVNYHFNEESERIRYRAKGWGTDYYTYESVSVGVVVENDND